MIKIVDFSRRSGYGVVSVEGMVVLVHDLENFDNEDEVGFGGDAPLCQEEKIKGFKEELR